MVFKTKEPIGIDPATTMTEPPAPVAAETVSVPRETAPAPVAPIMDARARMMSSLLDQARRGVKVVDNFNELKTMLPTKAPYGWPATLDGHEIIGMYQYFGDNGEGLAGNPILKVWTPLSREYCAAHEELKHIVTGFNAEGLYQCEDSLWGYARVKEWKEYNDALSYNKPQNILLRNMQKHFEKSGSYEERMTGAPDGSKILADYANMGMIDESEAINRAMKGRAASA